MAKLRPAATLILLRPASSSSGWEVACVHRAKGLRFLGDFWAFPGGRVDRGETATVACLRETFEEVGLLLLPEAESIPREHTARLREALLAKKIAFPALVEQLGLELSEDHLVPCGHWRTPPFGPVRFDTAFYLAQAPEQDALEAVGGEIDQAEWLDPALLLERWRVDEALLAPPTRKSLEVLAQGVSSELVARGEATWLQVLAQRLTQSAPPGGEYHGAIEFRPGIRLLPLRTPTLPPATHTNCYVLGGGSELVVIDPASPYEEERARLDALLEELAGEGRKVREILLTHHHQDHCSGAQYLAERLGVGIAGHARTREILSDKFALTREIAHNELIELPADIPQGRPRRLRAHLTEGHADGHLVFHEEVTGGVIAGDMVAGIGTIIIDPPEGKMALYLESVARLKELEASMLYPAHGPPIGDPAGLLEHYCMHRLWRERQVLLAFGERESALVEELVPRAYQDVKEELYPFAARSLLAHLEKLEAEGQTARSGERWRLLRPSR